MVRPLKLDERNIQLIESLARINCSHQEIAVALNISVDRLKKNKLYASMIEKGKEAGKTSLRRMMFRSAMNGSVVMQIFLSKQLLGYSDKAIVDTNNNISLTLNYSLPKRKQLDNTVTTEYRVNEETSETN